MDYSNQTSPDRFRSNRHEVGAFPALAYALSWVMWAPLVWLAVPEPLRSSLRIAGSFGPSAAALIVLSARQGWGGTRQAIARQMHWRLPVRLWLIVLLGPAVVMLTAIGISTLAGQPAGAWQDPTKLYLVIPVFAYVTLLGGPLGEEIGWRSYALPRLQQRHNPTVAALAVGLVWALWHAPLFAIEGTIQQLVPATAFVLQILTTSVIYTLLWNRTESLPLVITFHAAFNTSVGVLPILPDTAGSHTQLWIAIAIAVIIAATVITTTRGRLGFTSRIGASDQAGSMTRMGRSWNTLRGGPDPV